MQKFLWYENKKREISSTIQDKAYPNIIYILRQQRISFANTNKWY